jgi:hypothetical protein
MRTASEPAGNPNAGLPKSIPTTYNKHFSRAHIVYAIYPCVLTLKREPEVLAFGQPVQKLVVLQRDGSNVKVVAKDMNLKETPRFSPNGTQIAFRVISIYMAYLATGEIKKLVSGDASEMWPQWTPDGNSILYVEKHPDSDAIVRADVQTGTRTILKSFTGGECRCLSLSPDAQRIACFWNRPNPTETEWDTATIVLSMDGKEQQSLEKSTLPRSDYLSMAWFSDSSRLLLLSTVRYSARTDFMELNLATGTLKKLFTVTGLVAPADISKYDTICYANADGNLVFVENGLSTSISIPQFLLSEPSWSTDAKSLVCIGWPVRGVALGEKSTEEESTSVVLVDESDGHLEMFQDLSGLPHPNVVKRQKDGTLRALTPAEEGALEKDIVKQKGVIK